MNSFRNTENNVCLHVSSPVDNRLFLVYPHDSGALSQSFDELQMFDVGTHDLVSEAELGPRLPVQRAEPLDKWEEHLDPEGRVLNPERVKEQIFRGDLPVKVQAVLGLFSPVEAPLSDPSSQSDPSSPQSETRTADSPSQPESSIEVLTTPPSEP
ncbi:UNVERIFIED_CONTAM: hypothetical protein FKN15_030502 [Acipenser sinensis]